MNQELPNVQTGFRKARGTRVQIANIHCVIKKATEFHKKKSTSLTTLKPFTVDHNKLENSERDGSTRPPYVPPEKSVRRSRSSS